MRGNKKGILLTLATLVLFILMLGELTTYVLLNIDYSQIAAGSATATSSTALLGFLSGGVSSLLAASLNNSITALAVYESSPSLRTYHFINNTAYALESLMENGTVYGTNMSSYMGATTVEGYTSFLGNIVKLQGSGTFSLSNVTISVYQAAPLYIGAKMTGSAVLNTSYGTTVYPVYATANISINGTQNLLAAQAGGSSYAIGSMVPQSLVGNSFAISGSRSPFMFAYGTAIYIGGTPACSSVPAQFQSNNYILVTPNAGSLSSNICGMAGLVTNSLGALVPQWPYLVFPSNFITQNVIGNGTAVLLDGSALALLDPSGLQTAIQNGYYMPSTYTSSYLQQSQQQSTGGSGAGSFTLGQLNGRVANFNGASSDIPLSTYNGLPVGASPRTECAWVWYSNPSSTFRAIFDYGTYSTGERNGFYLNSVNGQKNIAAIGQADDVYSTGTVPPNAWTFICFTYNGAKTVDFYINGNFDSANTLSQAWDTVIGNKPYIGKGSGESVYWTGNLTNIQVYNSMLAPPQISQIYNRGLFGTPISNSSLVGWWPLNGNAKDYSGENNNGTAANVVYIKTGGYAQDPIFGNLPNAYNTSVVKGVLNCANLNQCTNTSLSHLYLGPRKLAVSGGVAQNESTALGILNGSLPNGIDFAADGALVQTTNGYSYNAYTIGFWFYPKGVGGNSWMLNSPSGTIQVMATTSTFEMNCAGSSISHAISIQYDTWHYATVTCYNSAGNNYRIGWLDGNEVFTGSVTASSIPPVNSLIFGNSSNFQGIVTDVQLYRSAFTTAQALELYLNNTVNGISPSGYWPLSSPLNGLENQTADIIGGNNGYISNATGVCSNANVISAKCGAYPARP